MRRIDYYVATSLDGYICGPAEDVSQFSQGGSGVDRYLADLSMYDAVFMGRKTYEFGYKYGLQPGSKAYPHMEHFIFSSNLELENAAPGIHVCDLQVETIETIRKRSGGPIYLCGGGLFAHWMLEHRMIDRIILKLNPILLGAGTRLFEGSAAAQLEMIEYQAFEDIHIHTYQVIYP